VSNNIDKLIDFHKEFNTKEAVDTITLIMRELEEYQAKKQEINEKEVLLDQVLL